MNPIDFMGWMNTNLGNDPEVVFAEEDEYLALYLGDLLQKQGLNTSDKKAAVEHASRLLEIIHKAEGKLNITIEFNGETHQVTQ